MDLPQHLHVEDIAGECLYLLNTVKQTLSLIKGSLLKTFKRVWIIMTNTWKVTFSLSSLEEFFC